MSQPLILVANPGSASRKYALYEGSTNITNVHFEVDNKRVVCSINDGPAEPVDVNHVTFSLSKLGELLVDNKLIKGLSDIQAIGIRVVAPSTYFQQHRYLDAKALEHLRKQEHIAPLHVSATLQEIVQLEKLLPRVKMFAISDSAFHATMPEYARHYGIPLNDAKKFGIMRYGYHGLSVESVVQTLASYHSVPGKLVVCHLGGGVSVSAVLDGKSIDTTMGYSPLEGLLMATRSGDIDPSAAHILQNGLHIPASTFQNYLNDRSGLLGVSGLSSDIRELLMYENKGNEHASLALNMFVYRIQQAIGKMAASLHGIEALVFTGTIGERSAIIRHRVCQDLRFLGIETDSHRNKPNTLSTPVHAISKTGSPVTTSVVSTNEMYQIAQATQELL